jgi:hypothetical protein
VVLDGTAIVRTLLFPLVFRCSIDGLRVARGPLGLKPADIVRLPTKPLRLPRLRVCVELLPACIVTLLVVLLRLKSETVIVS